MILRFRNLDLSIGRILKFNFLLKIKIRQQDGFLLELNLTFEENVLKFFERLFRSRDFTCLNKTVSWTVNVQANWKVQTDQLVSQLE